MKVWHWSRLIFSCNICIKQRPLGLFYACILSMMLTALCVFSGDYIAWKKLVTLETDKAFSVWVLSCVFRLLNYETLLTHQEQAKGSYPVWVILCVFGCLYWNSGFIQKDCKAEYRDPGMVQITFLQS